MSGFVGGSLGYRLLRRIGRQESPEEICDAGPYQDRSKLEALLGTSIWDEIANKTVIDFGCGNGTEAIEMARRGARRVVGIDIWDERPDLLDMARRAAAQAGVEDRCLFLTEPLEPSEIIISIDGFEHFDNPASVLDTMRRFVRDDGVALISVGHPWFHPYGGHLFSVFPWAHVVFTERALIRWRSDFKSDGATRFSEVAGGLNQITVREFRNLLASSDFSIDQLEAVPIRRLRPLWNSLTEELLTSTIRCRLIPRVAARVVAS